MTLTVAVVWTRSLVASGGCLVLRTQGWETLPLCKSGRVSHSVYHHMLNFCAGYVVTFLQVRSGRVLIEGCLQTYGLAFNIMKMGWEACWLRAYLC
jgi:hypothetical protein